MEDFIIHRAPKQNKDNVIQQLVNMKRSINNKKQVLKLISQFRCENPDFEFDTQLNIIKLLVNTNKLVEAASHLHHIKSTLFKRFSSNTLLYNRLRKSINIGSLDKLPTDVLNQIIDRPT